MKRKLIFSVALSLLLSLAAVAQQTQNTEDATIRQVVELYFDGWKNSNAESMKKAFHPKAKWFVIRHGDLSEITQPQIQSELNDDISSDLRARSQAVVMRIGSLDVTGVAASVKVAVEYIPYPVIALKGSNTPSFKITKVTEYLSLMKFSDGWKIVSKVLSEGEQQLQTTQSNGSPTSQQSSERVYDSTEVDKKLVILSKPEPAWTIKARQNNVKGIVWLRAVCTPSGEIKDIEVAEGLPDGLTEEAIKAFRKIKFVPAIKAGKPVSVRIKIAYYFDAE